MTELEKLIMHRQEVEDKISSLDKEIKEGVGLIITFGSHLKTARNRADTMHTVDAFLQFENMPYPDFEKLKSLMHGYKAAYEELDEVKELLASKGITF